MSRSRYAARVLDLWQRAFRSGALRQDDKITQVRALELSSIPFRRCAVGSIQVSAALVPQRRHRTPGASVELKPMAVF